MKGIVFSEFVKWVEEAYGPELADTMITQAALPSGGAYTAVGNYPHGEVIGMLVALTGLSGETIPNLARAYGRWLSGRFVVLYPELVGAYSSSRELLDHVESHIHMEVRKIYPEAQPPMVQAAIGDNGIRIDYSSHRPFAGVAHGLIEGFIEHFGENLTVTQSAGSDDGTSATFHIT